MTTLEGKLAIQRLSYGNYHKNVKKSIIMNKIQIDSGYPQDIFAKETLSLSKDLNYIQDNKKNLKNFFKDRIPQDFINKITYKSKNNQLDPGRIFQIKRQQHQLKNQTKITLNNSLLNKNKGNSLLNKNKRNSLSESQTPRKKKFNKIQQIFYINDKTLQMKQKYGVSSPPKIQSYSRDNHRRGTHSFAQKRSKIIKKQAYDKVFGPDISSISRTMPLTPQLTIHNQQQFDHKNKSISISRKFSYNKQTITNKRQQLSQLIKKIDFYKNRIKPIQLDYNQQQNIQSKQLNELDISQVKQQHRVKQHQQNQNKQQVIQLIKNITQVYKGYAIQNTRQKINTIDDLKKVDQKFFSQLTHHKKNRLQKRMFQLYKYTITQKNNVINSYQSKDSIQISRILGGTQNNQPSDILTVTDNYQLANEEQIKTNRIRKRYTIKQRLQQLGKNIVSAVFYSDIYMVKHNYIFQAFWQSRDPYQMEGSYAFFKAIKKNDMKLIKSFIQLDLNYLYQINTSIKTPLIYAVYNDKIQMVKLFLSLGSNVSKKDVNNKNALYYAIKNKNIQIIKLLLQHGAHPWSTQQCPYNKMLQQIKNNQINLLFSNAKKVFLGVRLQINNKKRSQFWHQIKHKIDENKKIQF